jgi:hypothetical protein
MMGQFDFPIFLEVSLIDLYCNFVLPTKFLDLNQCKNMCFNSWAGFES